MGLIGSMMNAVKVKSRWTRFRIEDPVLNVLVNTKSDYNNQVAIVSFKYSKQRRVAFH